MRLRVYIECIGILLDDDEGNRPVIRRCYDVKAIGIVEIIIRIIPEFVRRFFYGSKGNVALLTLCARTMALWHHFGSMRQ